MPKAPTTGRPSLFRGKTERYRVQGILSDEGGRLFDRVRAKIAEEMGHPAARISDADVIETAVRAYGK